MDPAPLHIITGKGGAGKTTLALAWAARLALGGDRVLVCEVEGRNGLAEATGNRPLTAVERPLFAAGAGSVHGLAVEPEAALTEYLERNAGLGIAGRALDRTGLGAFATSIAPGLRDILLIGKVYEAARRTAKGSPNQYGAVVLDAPPTGRIASFLTAGDALADVARGGPVHRQAHSIMALLRSPTTQVHLVTLLRELPVTETIETIAELRAHRFALGLVFCNQVAPAVAEPPTDLDLSLSPALRGDLLEVLAAASRRAAREDEWRRTLVPHAERLVDVPQVTGTLGAAGIVELGKDLP
ncbi:ArsA-related P-loop ATPase [Propionicicella superfundia]|uniref:ArsA-related P-loop ATPase n=1 Tax=Propionicicella superfundia TaxID=348582 RepID=UPI000417C1A6|nr:ArsA-related P-loop ATPase [Propionicicella superfundia]